MADEQLTQTENTETGAIPEIFEKASEEIEKQNKSETAQEEVSEQTKTDVNLDTAEENAEESAQAPDGAGGLENIDPEVLDCCRNAGFKDEVIATFSPELLADIRSELDGPKEVDEITVEQRQPPEKKQEQIQDVIEELKFNLDPDIVGADVKSAIDTIAKAVNENRKGFQEERQKLESERKIANTQRIDSCFDRFTKELPSLGNSSKLDRAAKNFREEVHSVAYVLSLRRNVPIERAIADAVGMYKYRDGKKVAERELLDKLNKQKSRLINPPTRRAGETQRKFKDEYDAADYRMAQAEQEAGY